MHPISNDFANAIKHSHTIVTKAEVLNSNYVLQGVLQPTQGNVRVDRENDIRRRCTVELVDPTGNLTPSDASDLIHPLSNNRLRLFRGVKLPNGTEEMVSLGVFDIFDSTIDDSGERVTINLVGFDLSKSVQRARLLNNYVVPVGERYDLAIRSLLSYQVPTLSFNIPTINFLTPPLVFGSNGNQPGGDPWKYASEMAQAVGYDIYFDIQGVVNMTPIPNPATDPVVWNYSEGEDSMLLYVDKKLSKEEVFNQVVVTGDNSFSDELIRAEAKDTNPNSPTYIFGPYGSVPTFLYSEYVTTVAQAQQVADARLRQVLGMTEGLQIITTPNPAHEVGDIVTVKRDRIQVDANYVIDKFNVSLNHNVANNMTLRRVVG